jgi:formate dehydrogenase major subunit
VNDINSRLTEPLVRIKGDLKPTTWERAIARATEGLQAAINQGSTESFGLFSCSKATNEVNFLAQKFARVVMGSNNIDSCNRT